METLTSLRNPLLKDVRRAVSNGALTDEGYCVAEGPHLLQEALRSRCPAPVVFTSGDRPLNVPAGTRVVALEPELFRGISSTETSQGIVALVQPPIWTLEQLFATTPLVVILDRLQDPGNAGTILRAAEAFGATGVALLKGCVSPYNPKVMRAAAGSSFRIPLVANLTESDLLAAFQRRRIGLFAASARGAASIAGADWALPCGIVIGSEAHGVSPALAAAATSVRIPTIGVESLNAAMAAAVILYEASRRRHEPV